MAEVLSKTGVSDCTLTYGGTLPFSMYVYDLDIDAVADIFDATSGTDTGRRLGKTGLASGRVIASGFMTAASGITLASTVVSEETTATGQSITLQFGTGSGSGGGGSGHALVLKGVIERAKVKSTKTAGYVSVLVAFQLCGVQP